MVSCPNCGSTMIDTKWVLKREERNPESFSKYINRIIKDREQEIDAKWISGSTNYNEYYKLECYIQVVVNCRECGYTQVVNLKDWKVADEL